MGSPETSRKEQVQAILERRKPDRIVYAANYWQWFAHHRNHGILPDEIEHCHSQLDLLNYLGLDVFSRNIYCDEQKYWFGGLAKVVWDGVVETVEEKIEHQDKIIRKTYRVTQGKIFEQLKYEFKQSTLVQEEFAIKDYDTELDAFEKLVTGRAWEFNFQAYQQAQEMVGNAGVVMTGEVFSPLKMLHLLMGPVNTVYFIADYPEQAAWLMSIHETRQLKLVEEMALAGVPAIISMDNLDTMFHPPQYVEQYCASFYEKASRICHQYGSTFFIHACGRQKDNLKLIASLGVDGLEGVAFPPLGDIQLDEVLKVTGDKFIISGGISAIETRELGTRKEIFNYVKTLFERIRPYSNRFMLSASCNTSIDTSWETIKNLRDAWLEYR